MPLRVRLQDENGEVLDVAGDSGVGEKGFWLATARRENYLLTTFIDLYGQTVFNRLQMPALIEEFQRLRADVPSEAARDSLTRIIELAERCQNEVHLYLVFVGD
jgi:hypothetical protein